MRQLGLSICALTVLVICTASAYKTGAPAGACEALQPKHKDYKPQTTASPFKITAKRNKDTVDVTISGSTEKFKGFLLVGRTADSEDNQGEWLPVENAKLVKCSKDNVSNRMFKGDTLNFILTQFNHHFSMCVCVKGCNYSQLK